MLFCCCLLPYWFSITYCTCHWPLDNRAHAFVLADTTLVIVPCVVPAHKNVSMKWLTFSALPFLTPSYFICHSSSPLVPPTTLTSSSALRVNSKASLWQNFPMAFIIRLLVHRTSFFHLSLPRAATIWDFSCSSVSSMLLVLSFLRLLLFPPLSARTSNYGTSTYTLILTSGNTSKNALAMRHTLLRPLFSGA